MEDEIVKNENTGRDDDGVVYDAEIVEETPAGGTGSVRPFWMDLLIILGVYIGSTIILGVLAAGFAALTKGSVMLATVIAQIMVYVVTIPVAVWLLRSRGMKKPILSFSFRKADPIMILWGFLLMFVMGVVIEPLLNLFPESNMDQLNALITEGGGLGMLLVVIVAPLFEEMLFRGVVQGGASREYGPMRGILIAAALFGVVHLVPQQVINAFFAGIILGYVYYRTGSLIPVMAIHLLNNSIAYIMTRMFPEDAFVTTREMIGNDTWYWILYAVCAAVFVFAMVKLWRQLDKVDKKIIVGKK